MRFLSVTAIVVLMMVGTASNGYSQCASSACGNSHCQACCNGYGHCCGHCCNMPLAEAFCRGYRANVYWPAQYIPAARRSVYSAYDAMTNNGWRRQNLLGTYHFDEHTNELTDAGKLKVQWILTQTPLHRRTIFVERGLSEQDTSTRIASVQHWTGSRSPAVGPVDVQDTHIVAEGRSAGTVDNIFTGFQVNQKPPVLPSTSRASSSSSSASQ